VQVEDCGLITPWTMIPGYDLLYALCTIGHKAFVWSYLKKELKSIRYMDGYPRLNLSKNGVSKTVYLHQLVYLTTKGPLPQRYHGEVCHTDTYKLDLCPNNLEIGTRGDQKKHFMATQRVAKKACNLSEEDVVDILVSPESNRVVGKRYGIGHGTTGTLRTGQSRTPLTGPFVVLTRLFRRIREIDLPDAREVVGEYYSKGFIPVKNGQTVVHVQRFGKKLRPLIEEALRNQDKELQRKAP